METAATVTLASILTDISSIVTACIGWVGDFMSVIAGNPLLLLFVCLPVVGLGVGIIRRLISL